jgi:hypothetical protein
MATSDGVLGSALQGAARRLSERGHACAQVEDDRVVAALDDDNVVQAWITADTAHQLLSVQVRSARRVGREAWTSALRDLNVWNRDHRLTSAWLLVDDWDHADDAAVVVEAALPVTTAHSPDQLGQYVDIVLADAARFWRLTSI